MARDGGGNGGYGVRAEGAQGTEGAIREGLWYNFPMLTLSDCHVADLAAITRTPTRLSDHPLAAHIQQGIPVYDCAALRQRDDADGILARALQAEWARVWMDGPGVLVLQGAYPDVALVDAVSAAFTQMIETQRVHGGGADHFAKPGANDRVWNALQKLCVLDPALFARYYANEMVAWACAAWLGPGYQVTSQINCVNPGGAAQVAHRDYHLGFCDAAGAARYPEHVHRLSPGLTLQGAVAHVDMPVESGPTLYLPHSQKYLPGYLVAGQPAFQAFFDAHHVQLPLRKGDAVFFNPALMHAAGHNRTADVRRLANLLQISSAFGRAMEAVDRQAMCAAAYPALQALHASGQLSAQQLEYAVAACAEGYAFPTNLDRDPPVGGLAPPSQQALMLLALQQNWPVTTFHSALRAHAEKRIA